MYTETHRQETKPNNTFAPQFFIVVTIIRKYVHLGMNNSGGDDDKEKRGIGTAFLEGVKGIMLKFNFDSVVSFIIINIIIPKISTLIDAQGNPKGPMGRCEYEY